MHRILRNANRILGLPVCHECRRDCPPEASRMRASDAIGRRFAARATTLAVAAGLAVTSCATIARPADRCATGEASPAPRLVRASAPAPETADIDVLVVRSLDLCTGQPLAGTLVSVLGSTPAIGASSDSTGVVVLRLRSGVHRVLVRHIGHAKTTLRARVRPGFRDTIDVALRRSPPLIYY